MLQILCKYEISISPHQITQSISEMGSLQLSLHRLSAISAPYKSNDTNKPFKFSRNLTFRKGRSIRAVSTSPVTGSDAGGLEEPPVVNIAFVHSVLLPDGTPDVHFRRACGGQKLRDIMLDTNLELYGPYDKPLSNCAGGGTCATCVVEIVEGKELLSPRTEKEKEKLKTNPKNWRLACQTTLRKPESTGLVVVQQLPEYKIHEWKYDRSPPALNS